MSRNYLAVVDEYLFPKSLQNNLWACCRETDKLVWVRLGCLLYLTGVYIWALAFMPNAIENIIYLTMEGYFLTWVYFALALEDYLSRRIAREEVFPGLWKLTYLIHEIAMGVEVPITLVFWTLLFRILLEIPGVDANTIACNANLHAGPFLCLVIDLYFNGIEFPKNHYYATFLFGTIYLLINMRNFRINGVWSVFEYVIYRPIDWVSVLSYVLVACCYLLTFLTHWLCGKYFEKVKKDKLLSMSLKQNLSIRSYMHDQV